jgi:hypothetical protein
MNEIKNWFESELWPTYPRDLCNRIGSKPVALKSALKMVKNKSDATIVIEGLREQMRYLRKLKKSGAHDSEWKLPMLSTWLNQERWGDEIPSHYELQKKLEPKLCRCGSEVMVSDLCSVCYEKIVAKTDWRVIRCREFYVANGLGIKHTESRQQWLARLKTTAKQQLARIG